MPKFLVNGIANPTNIIVDVPKLQAGYSRSNQIAIKPS